MRRAKRVMTLVVAIVIAAGLCPSPALGAAAQSGEARGASGRAQTTQTRRNDVVDSWAEKDTLLETQATKNLKQLGLKFDLKNGKSVTVKEYARGAGNLKYTAKVSGLKVRSAGNGLKKATFTVSFKLKGLSSKQRAGILKSFHDGYTSDQIFGVRYYALIDYDTGRSLEYEKNKFSVKCEVLKDKSTQTKTYYDSDGCWFYLGKTWTRKVTVTYPANYKGLCLAVGGLCLAAGDETFPVVKEDKATQNYFTSGKYHFDQTSYYKKSKSNIHVMRIK